MKIQGPRPDGTVRGGGGGGAGGYPKVGRWGVGDPDRVGGIFLKNFFI